jgi:hypothetical protein
MSKLVSVELGDGHSILIEADEAAWTPGDDLGLRGSGRGGGAELRTRFEALESTLRAFTDRTVKALRAVDADVEKVTLEFGLGLGGELGVPYVTKGASGSNLNVKVECSLAKSRVRPKDQRFVGH